LQNLAIDRLKPGRFQPRTRMDDASLAELADSIREQGVMQPILVRPSRAAASRSSRASGAGARRRRRACAKCRRW
jgi:ParB family chromosome partitioning protein